MPLRSFHSADGNLVMIQTDNILFTRETMVERKSDVAGMKQKLSAVEVVLDGGLGIMIAPMTHSKLADVLNVNPEPLSGV